MDDIVKYTIGWKKQIKAKKSEYTGSKIKDLFNLILKAVAVAMGIAVIVLNILDKTDIKTSIILLGIGIFCIGLYLLDDKNTNELK